MKINKIYFCLVLSLLVVTVAGSFSAAYAADADKWTGFYAGVNVGYGMGRPTTSFMPMKADSSGQILPSTGTASGDFQDLMPQQLHPAANGIIGGGQVGFNMQLKRFVFGAETDIQGSAMDGSKTVAPIVRADGTNFTLSTNSFLRASQHTNYFGTFRPRVGFVLFPKLLIYATGGVAYGSVDMFAESHFGTGFTDYFPVPALKGKQKSGYTAGAGLEYRFAKRLSVKGEYLFYDLGTEHVIAPTTPSFGPSFPYYVGYGIATKAHILRGGLNYRF